MEFTSQEIQAIVEQVMKNLDQSRAAAYAKAPASEKGRDGVFENVSDAIEAAHVAQRDWYENYNLADRKRIVENIRRTGLQHVEELARMAVEETGMGRVEDKIVKLTATLKDTPGPECLTTDAISGDSGLMLEEHAPFGVIGAITPSTNPVATVYNNAISMISGGNSVVFNVHPGAKKVCAYSVQLIHQAIVEAGGPRNLVVTTPEPTMENVTVMTKSPHIRLMAGTGGMPMVISLLSSGKKTIGAGAGNPPIVVDETADIRKAAKELYRGASFDNGIMCFAEKEVFVLEEVASELIFDLVDEGAYLLNNLQMEQIVNLCLQKKGNEWVPNKKWVGKNASVILEAIGVTDHHNTRLLIAEVPNEHPYVGCEQLMPVLPIVRCKNFDEAVDRAVAAEHGNRHTAGMYSKNVDRMTKFSRAIETTIFVKNGSTLCGDGIGGEGNITLTIAGPTGEGLTNAVSFTRKRRCVLADGGLRVI